MLIMFYGSMEKKGLFLKDFCVSHMENRQKKTKKKTLKYQRIRWLLNKALISNKHSHKRFKANKHPGA